MMFLSRDDRRRIADTYLRLHPEWSNRRIARVTRLSREMVLNRRIDLVEAGEIPDVTTVVGYDRKTYHLGGCEDEHQESGPLEEVRPVQAVQAAD